MSTSTSTEKKRGRKKKQPNVVIDVQETVTNEKPAPKKRGRKPKGGKIIQPAVNLEPPKFVEPNIILHLKCYLSDLNNNTTYQNNIDNIQSYDFQNKLNAFVFDKSDNSEENDDNDEDDDDFENTDEKQSIKQIWKKLSSLKLNLHKNNISDKRAACFWCSHDFDNPPIFIPKHEVKNTYEVYGCFCSPECATAFLMEERIDSSIKFERYQLLNNIYGKIYNYEKNIKPAPNPYYLLDKYYGNLTIQQYRQLFNNEQLLLVVDKPLTHVFPELYEDNSDFLLNQKIIPNNSQFKLKRKSSSKKPSILDNLGINKN